MRAPGRDRLRAARRLARLLVALGLALAALGATATLPAGAQDDPIGDVIEGITGGGGDEDQQEEDPDQGQDGDSGGGGGSDGGDEPSDQSDSVLPAPSIGITPLQLTMVPRAVRVSRRTRFTLITYAYIGGRRVRIAGANVRFAGRRRVTNRFGHAIVHVAFPRAGFVQGTASKPGLRPAVSAIEVLGRLPRPPGREPGERPCISGRHTIKNLADPRVRLIDPRPIQTNLSSLWLLRPPRHLGAATPRLPGIERHVYRMRVRLVSLQLEPDLDIHLVVAEPGRPRRTMITELPHSRCYTVAVSPYRNAMISARAALFRACGRSYRRQRRIVGTGTVTGVGFWDRRHGQYGVARNGVELHPLLGFQSHGRCRAARAKRKPRR